jgi:hypothetical protein
VLAWRRLRLVPIMVTLVETLWYAALAPSPHPGYPVWRPRQGRGGPWWPSAAWRRRRKLTTLTFLLGDVCHEVTHGLGCGWMKI